MHKKCLHNKNVIILDLGHTLTNPTKAFKIADKKIYQYLLKRKIFKKSWNSFRRILLRTVEEFSHAYQGIERHNWKNMWKLFFDRINFNADEKWISNFAMKYERIFLSVNTLYPDVIKTLQELKNKNFKLALVSNDSIQRVKKTVKKYGLQNFFDICLASESVGAEKASGKPFKIILKKLKEKPKNVITVGDELREDIFPSKKLGIVSVLILRNKINYNHYLKEKVKIKIKPDFIIKNLKQLRELLNIS